MIYTKHDLDNIKDAILAEVTPNRIILFGSYASGNQNYSSDIDIMILMNEEISRTEKLNLLYRIERKLLYLKYPIDLVLKSITQFNEYKNYIGTINYDASKYGKILWTKN